MGILSCADNSLTGEVKVTGVIGKGTYQCTWDGDWHSEAYDDYALLAKKLAGIANVAKSQEQTANSQYFNLAGQRVAHPAKGLYIVNGKKVIVK